MRIAQCVLHKLSADVLVLAICFYIYRKFCGDVICISPAELGEGNITYLYVIIPQTVRRLLPLSINLVTRMIKTTSLILMIGVVEVIKVAQQIIEANRATSPNAAFGVYLVVFIMYFIVCFSISMVAKHLEKKWS